MCEYTNRRATTADPPGKPGFVRGAKLMVTPRTLLPAGNVYGPREGATAMIGDESAIISVDTAYGVSPAVWDAVVEWTSQRGWEPEDDIPNLSLGQHDVYLLRAVTWRSN